MSLFFWFLIVWFGSIYLYSCFLSQIEKERLFLQSKDFKIDDPVVVSCIGDRVIYTHIDWYDAKLDKFSLESLYIEWVSPERLRHPTQEELEKYFRK